MIHWALIGYGGMGGWHVQQMQTLQDEIHICGVYDIKPERNAAARAKGLHAYDTLEALLSDPQIQLVTIAVPNDSHLPLTVAALKAGKHVICEKPVANSSNELQQMIDAAQDAGKLFSVHQNRRFDGDYLAMKKVYDENTLGKVFRVESRVHGSRGVPGDWRNKKRHGGGMILDWGVHLIDQILQMIPQDVVSTHCIMSHVTNDEVDDGFTSTLTFADGTTALIEVGTSNFVSLPRWYVLGENGTAVVEDWWGKGKIVMVSDWEKRDAVPVVTAAGLTKTMAPRTEDTIQTYPLPVVPSDVRDYYRNFIAAIQDGEKLLVTYPQMLRVMRVMEAMFRSAESNQVIHTRI